MHTDKDREKQRLSMDETQKEQESNWPKYNNRNVGVLDKVIVSDARPARVNLN